MREGYLKTNIPRKTMNSSPIIIPNQTSKTEDPMITKVTTIDIQNHTLSIVSIPF